MCIDMVNAECASTWSMHNCASSADQSVVHPGRVWGRNGGIGAICSENAMSHQRARQGRWFMPTGGARSGLLIRCGMHVCAHYAYCAAVGPAQTLKVTHLAPGMQYPFWAWAAGARWCPPILCAFLTVSEFDFTVVLATEFGFPAGTCSPAHPTVAPRLIPSFQSVTCPSTLWSACTVVCVSGARAWSPR